MSVLIIHKGCWVLYAGESTCFCTQKIFNSDDHTCMLYQSSCICLFVLVMMHPSSPQWKHEKKCPVFAFSSALPLSLVINHNLFAWMLPCCSGSLSTVCPCVPSGVCILSEDFVSVAYFYAKQIFPHRMRTWENGDGEQKSGEKVGQQASAQRRRIQCFRILWSCYRAGWQ